MPEPLKKILPFKLGADPEFNITMQNKRVAAEDIIRRVMSKNYKAKGMGFDIPGCGEFGWDGSSPTGEVRPLPAFEPQKVTDNLGGMFKAFVKEIGIFDLSVLSFRASVGGHIHFDVPTELKLNESQVYNIHKKLTAMYLPILLSEDRLNVMARLKGGYGKMGDWRTESKTSARPMLYEFRVPSAEWLTTPKIANATLAYLGVVYTEILYHPKNFTTLCKDVIFHSDKQATALQELALSKYTAFAEFIMRSIAKALPKFHLYQNFEDEIEYIMHPERVLRDKKHADFNIVRGWKLESGEQPNKRMLLSNKELKKRADRINLDDISNLVTIQYNNDTNVELFVKAIKDRILLLNWKLKHNYYFFGLRAGIKDFIAISTNDKVLYGNKQIKTKLDLEGVRNLFTKMSGRANIPSYTKDGSVEPVVLVGIPYSMRQANEVKPFISFVADLERQKKAEDPIDQTQLIDDRNTKNPIGEVAAVLINENNLRDIRIEEGASPEYHSAQQDVRSEEARDGQLPFTRGFECTNCGHRFTESCEHIGEENEWTNGQEANSLPLYEVQDGDDEDDTITVFCTGCNTDNSASIRITLPPCVE